MKLLSMLFLLAALMSMTGCASYVPPDNVDFAVVNDIGDFCGTYANQGIGEKSDAPNKRIIYLSSLFWPALDNKQNALISKVEISRFDGNSVFVRAIGANGVEKEAAFVRGRDFDLENGRICLSRQWGLPSPIVGIGYKTSYIGLDVRKDGKYKERTSAAGLLALLIPFAASVSGEVRFERLAD